MSLYDYIQIGSNTLLTIIIIGVEGRRWRVRRAEKVSDDVIGEIRRDMDNHVTRYELNGQLAGLRAEMGYVKDRVEEVSGAVDRVYKLCSELLLRDNA